MKNHLFNKRIPTVFGIGFVILGVVLTTIVANNQTGLKSKASNSEEPQNIKVSNLSDKSFTITYQTDAAVTGSVNYGRDKNLGNTELEDLDREKGDFSPKNIHSITIKKLSPKTKYNLVIVSGQNTFLNNGSPFEITTAPNIPFPSASQYSIKGNVFLPDGNPPSEALVYLSTQNSQLLSSSTAKNGEFDFPLKSLRSENLSSYINLNENTILKLVVISNDSLKSTALVSLNKKDSIPTITLPNDYDFTNDLVPIASKSAESKSLGFPTIVPKQTNLKLQILTPKKNQSFTDRKPQFRGTSLPNEKVEITIHSDENITTSVTADSNGNWTYEPPANLSAGEHTIIINTRDASGILTTLTQSFTVFASEAIPTSVPTPTLSPTPTLTSTSTPAPFISTASTIESKGGLSPTGDFPFTQLTIGGIATTIIGVTLLLLTRASL
ncbi:MAG: hypothetical protein A3H79_02805 [Candidatus Levybacteria bacterium RIFCSPLOWO2_02_FULL_36_8b]|nr:MAG: hypothetical protein A3H79_02805 [Candidatus Levybacteria bacterium RIFCSPLOWO2_02_FULL_36_8b]